VLHLRTILTLILDISEACKLLADFALSGRDMLVRGASRCPKVRKEQQMVYLHTRLELMRIPPAGLCPDPRRLVRVDDSAPEDEFVSQDGRTVGPGEMPVFEVAVPGANGAHIGDCVEAQWLKECRAAEMEPWHEEVCEETHNGSSAGWD
jgi:hypothetical protein